MIDDPRGRAVSAQQVVDLLNEAARLDPVAMRLLVMEARVPCNDALADHPTIQVGPVVKGSKQMVVGLLGILNGLFGTFSDGWGCIHSVIEKEDPTVPIRFEVRGRPEAETGE